MFYDVVLTGIKEIRCLNLTEVQVVTLCLIRMYPEKRCIIIWYKESHDNTTLGDWGYVNPYTDYDKFSHEVAALKPTSWTKEHIEDSREYIE